ncbi:papain-like cysteine protease family protein [Pyruvatibacter sp.]|uniref:papain-like cysteine protease family protein n=1 Tax=Pyruvatibacter sp. TaxID=1981328 RepID=UPI0032657C98
MAAHKPWQIGLSHSNSQPVCSVACKGNIYSGCNGYIHETDPETGTVNGYVDLSNLVGKPSGEECTWDVTVATANNEDALIVGFQGWVFRFEPGTLRVIWRTSLPSTGYKTVSLAVSGTKVYAGTVGRVYKLDYVTGGILHLNGLPERKEKHVELCYGEFWGHLGVGTNGYFILLDGEDLHTIGESSLTGCGYNRVDVAVGPERFYAASQGYLYEILPESGDELIRLDPTNRQSGVTRLSVCQDKLCAGADGQLFCLDIVSSDGDRRWTLEENWNLTLDPGATREAVHVLALDGIVYASHRGYIYGYSTGSDETRLRHESLPGCGNGEVSMVAYNRYLVMGISGMLAYCPPAIANFELQIQQQSRWCWLALTSSIACYYDGNQSPLRWAQCNLANSLLNQEICCMVGSVPQCDKRGRLFDALTLSGNLDKVYKYPFDIEYLAEALSYARPLAAQVSTSTSGHGVIVSGIHPNGTIDVRDPSNGQTSIVSYDTLLNNYNGGFKWTATFSTK